MSNCLDDQGKDGKRFPISRASWKPPVENIGDVGPNLGEDLGEMVGEEGAECPHQRGALNPPLVKPIEARHGVVGLEYLLGCPLK